MAYLPYYEPSITSVLSLASFIILLNGVRSLLDRVLYCGLVGEVLVGVIGGSPVGGNAWLRLETQEAIQVLGYIGLLGLVFEGGLSTSTSQLCSTLLLSVPVAAIGLLVPFAISFILLIFPFPDANGTKHPTPLAAFSAGASLCSTSLGTTFAILSAAKLHNTRLSTVLVGAAMMDDVVGLVMVKIVVDLGQKSFSTWSIARPIIASIGLLLVILVITPWVLQPGLSFIANWLRHQDVPDSTMSSRVLGRVRACIRATPHLSFLLSVLLLFSSVTVADYIDASVLFAAFLAGGIVKSLGDLPEFQEDNSQDGGTKSISEAMYDKYYRPLVDFVLAPFFFASIGFAIPIRNMFDGQVAWKGIVYGMLMAFAKGVTSVVVYIEFDARKFKAIKEGSAMVYRRPDYPALIISLAMITRGELGFLIASLAASSGSLTLAGGSTDTSQNSGDTDIFLVIIWAVVLCTLAGPIGVGVVVRKLRRLESSRTPGYSVETRKTILEHWA